VNWAIKPRHLHRKVPVRSGQSRLYFLRSPLCCGSFSLRRTWPMWEINAQWPICLFMHESRGSTFQRWRLVNAVLFFSLYHEVAKALPIDSLESAQSSHPRTVYRSSVERRDLPRFASPSSTISLSTLSVGHAVLSLSRRSLIFCKRGCHSLWAIYRSHSA
jgi:hypothetical protein